MIEVIVFHKKKMEKADKEKNRTTTLIFDVTKGKEKKWEKKNEFKRRKL